MIRAVIGVPGAGKTYFVMHCMERELVASKRWVVTNLTEIKLPEFQAYLTAKYPKHGIDLAQRLQIIPKHQSRHWVRYRGHYTMPSAPEKGKTELPEDYDARLEAYLAAINKTDPGGVCYFLDEAHRWAKAEEWQTYAALGIFYLAQHRHLNDTFWFSTQNPEQVIPTLRRAAQDAHLLRNHYVESFSYFQKPGCFYRESFGHVPETKRRTSEPYDTGRMKLDKEGLGNCYQTRGALGGEVSVAEEKPPQRKLPFWTIFLAAGFALAVAVGALWLFPRVVVGGMASLLSSGEKLAKDKLAPKLASAVDAAPAGTVATPQYVKPEPKNDIQPRAVASGDVRVSYCIVKGNTLRVGLTNGRVLTEMDGEVLRVDPRGVQLKNGQWLQYVTPQSRPAPPASRGDRQPVVQGLSGATGVVDVGPTVPTAPRESRTEVANSQPAPSKESGSPFANTYQLPRFGEGSSDSEPSARQRPTKARPQIR